MHYGETMSRWIDQWADGKPTGSSCFINWFVLVPLCAESRNIQCLWMMDKLVGGNRKLQGITPSASLGRVWFADGIFLTTNISKITQWIRLSAELRAFSQVKLKSWCENADSWWQCEKVCLIGKCFPCSLQGLSASMLTFIHLEHTHTADAAQKYVTFVGIWWHKLIFMRWW